MVQQVARMQDKYKVNTFWLGVPNSKIKMDFEPLVKEFDLHNHKNWAMLHWQALPKGLRRWGIFYCNANGKTNYIPFDWDKFTCEGEVNFFTAQIDETVNNTKPTAVMLFHNVNVIVKGNNVILKKLST